MAGTITLAAGLRNMDGSTYERATWSTVATLATAIEEAEQNLEVEGWWSPHVFRGARRSEDWVQASCLAIDIDGPTKKDGEALPTPLREQLEDLFQDGRAPGSVMHVTHSGFRIVYALRSPTRSKEAWVKAHAGARELVRRWCVQQGLVGFDVDPAVANLANLNWLPCTTDEKGRSRDATCYSQERLFTVAELGSVEHEEEARAPEAREQPTGSVRDRRRSLECLLRLGVGVATEYETWVEVGQVLHVVWGGSEAGLDVWHAWSKQAPNYDPKALDKRWRTFKASGRGLGSLVFLARSQGEDGAWEGGVETLSEMGFQTARQVTQRVEPPEPDEDWVQHVRERQESEGAPAPSQTFRSWGEPLYVAPLDPVWFPQGTPAPRG